MTNQRLPYLLSQYLSKSCSAAELREFYQLIDEPAYDNELQDLLDAAIAGTPAEEVLTDTRQQEMVHTILQRSAKPARVSKLWPRIAAAAAILIAVSAGIYFTQNRTVENAAVVANDIAPGKNTATLTLANGKTINLSDAKTGVVIDDSKLTYNDGSLVRYSSGSHFSGSTKVDQKNTGPVGVTSLGVQVLTASTPRGGTYQITLPDGSKVWLNAASTIKFPSTFNGLVSRNVELTGEAYFEIFRNKKQPFVVNSKKLELTVLGTHFNVNAYEDEVSVKTTLLEGAVRLAALSSTGGGAKGAERKEVVLKPNEQALLTNNKIAVSPVDASKAIAWKNGKFVFEYESIESVMRKLARWYNVEIIYEGNFEGKTFTGSISRFDNISKILEKITYTEDVNFKIKGRRIWVMN